MYRIQYTLNRAVARLAAPVMRATGWRFTKASRNSKVINLLIDRVAANLLADGIEPGKLIF